MLPASPVSVSLELCPTWKYSPTLYMDENDNVTLVEDNLHLIRTARAHYEKVGLGADFVNQFIR